MVGHCRHAFEHSPSVGFACISYLALETGREREKWIRFYAGGKTPLAATVQYGIWTMARLLLLACCFTICFGSSAKADEKVFDGWVLHLFLDSSLKEYTDRESMAVCLRVKRKILRQGRGVGTRWECAKAKIVLRKFDAGEDGTKWLPVEHLGKQ